MKLGDRIQLKVSKQKTFEDGYDVDEDEYVIIGVSYGMAHCFGKDMWSRGFNSFEYGKREDGRPDIVKRGSVYVPTPDYLDMKEVKDLHYDKKIVDWTVLE